MKLVLIRHGQSTWNLENRFTGWTDVDLTEQGVNEAIQAGKSLKEENIDFAVAYTSVLKRANKTLDLVLEQLHQEIPVYYSWRLNERHYGALQGLNKKETADKYGDEQVRIWRRSANVKPPLLDITDERYPGFDPLYKDLTKDELPKGEHLLDTVERVLPYYEDNIKVSLLEGKNVLVVAHGNSLRALIKHLENINDADIMNVELETGVPVIYDLDNNLNIISKKILK